MKIIQELSEMIEEELEGAENYVKLAIHYKAENPSLASTFYEISTQEMRHVTMLHEEVVKCIKSYREKHGDPPQAMQAVYDWLHKKHIEEATDVKRYQDQYANS